MKITSKFNGKCRSCGGWINKGDECDWTRGAGITHIGACPAPKPQGPVQPPVTMGVFRKADGRIFVVKPNKAKTNCYAKEIIESAPRMTESGMVRDFETVYRPGAIYDLTEAERWDLAEARDFLTKYARCIVCGAHLKAAKSVAGAIGPVCAKYFKTAQPPVPAPTPIEVEDEAQAPGYFEQGGFVQQGDGDFDEFRAEAIANGIDPDEGTTPLKRHHHTKGDGSWWEYDAQGIPLCRVCSACRSAKLATYRPEILTGYTQADIDEPIEPDEPDCETNDTDETIVIDLVQILKDRLAQPPQK